jgi:predicted nucleic-acid-binding Zn-ribbon protein
MKDGHCPMCKSSEVYSNPYIRFYGSNTRVYLMAEDRNTKADVQAHFTPYICMGCGFTAMYVNDMNDIKDLPKLEGWKKVAK